MRFLNSFGAAIVLAVMIPVFGVASATTVYIAQTAAGSANGTSCANAYAVTFFNTSSNWGSGGSQIGPGTVVHLCGTVTTEMAFQSSGTSGAVIELLFETGANISLPYCDTNACLSTRGNSYLLIDGGASTPCGWNTATNVSEGTCNGFIQATENGSALTYQNPGYGIALGGGTNVEIRNLGVYNIYVHTSGSADVQGGAALGIFNTGGTNNLSVHDCDLHDAQWFMVTTWTTTSGFTFYNNQVYNSGHTVALAGAANSGSFTGINIYGNYFHDYSNWDASGCPEHEDGIHIYAQATPSTVSANIYNNIFGGAYGTCLTAHIFQESTTIAGTENIYNNLLYFTNNSTGGSGMIALGPTSGTISLYNNTIQCSAANGAPLGVLLNVATFNFENNVISNCQPLIWWEGGTLTALNNNGYAGCTTSCFKDSSGNYDTFPQWQTATGKDGSGSYTSGSANLNSSFQPQSGSFVIGLGANLTSLGIATLDSDLAGAARPASASGVCPGSTGCWGAGALQSSSGPNPPTNLTVTAQ